jgi:2-methylcitrate dehydratase PrpD
MRLRRRFIWQWRHGPGSRRQPVRSPSGPGEWRARGGAAGALAPPGDWLILDGYLKPFAAARHVHYGAQAALDWRGGGGDWRAIEALRLDTYGEALAYCGNRAPGTAIQAQFSLAYGLAWALVHGGLGPDAYTAAALQDRAVCRLEALTEIAADDAAYRPGSRGARLIVTTSEGDRVVVVDRVAGDPDRPMTADQVHVKFLTYAAPGLGPRAEHIAGAILDAPLDAPIGKCVAA